MINNQRYIASRGNGKTIISFYNIIEDLKANSSDDEKLYYETVQRAWLEYWYGEH